MGIAITRAVWESSIPMPERIVALCLADFCRDDGACWPSIETIAKMTTQSESTVKRCIKRLVDDGWLTRRKRAGNYSDGRKNQSNQYQFTSKIVDSSTVTHPPKSGQVKSDKKQGSGQVKSESGQVKSDKKQGSGQVNGDPRSVISNDPLLRSNTNPSELLSTQKITKTELTQVGMARFGIPGALQ
ncbi:helix-turn-helix domain-containing protein [Dongshaea marina]|uniref:helix-turn-helix domain-containing protein n=1 Tax=Dongshaea marina TaxID=2047966 RepID=UPI00131F0A1A|nr:helix-turn-helix domain-containing protein [Dongshaea marina]